MAKVTIEITDLPGDKVEIKMTPNFEMIAKMEDSGHALTPAHGYGIALANKAREISKSNDPTNKIIIPKIW